MLFGSFYVILFGVLSVGRHFQVPGFATSQQQSWTDFSPSNPVLWVGGGGLHLSAGSSINAPFCSPSSLRRSAQCCGCCCFCCCHCCCHSCSNKPRQQPPVLRPPIPDAVHTSTPPSSMNSSSAGERRWLKPPPHRQPGLPQKAQFEPPYQHHHHHCN